LYCFIGAIWIDSDLNLDAVDRVLNVIVTPFLTAHGDPEQLFKWQRVTGHMKSKGCESNIHFRYCQKCSPQNNERYVLITLSSSSKGEESIEVVVHDRIIAKASGPHRYIEAANSVLVCMKKGFLHKYCSCISKKKLKRKLLESKVDRPSVEVKRKRRRGSVLYRNS
jgi:hypothetical protein